MPLLIPYVFQRQIPQQSRKSTQHANAKLSSVKRQSSFHWKPARRLALRAVCDGVMVGRLVVISRSRCKTRSSMQWHTRTPRAAVLSTPHPLRQPPLPTLLLPGSLFGLGPLVGCVKLALILAGSRKRMREASLTHPTKPQRREIHIPKTSSIRSAIWTRSAHARICSELAAAMRCRSGSGTMPNFR